MKLKISKKGLGISLILNGLILALAEMFASISPIIILSCLLITLGSVMSFKSKEMIEIPDVDIEDIEMLYMRWAITFVLFAFAWQFLVGGIVNFLLFGLPLSDPKILLSILVGVILLYSGRKLKEKWDLEGMWEILLLSLVLIFLSMTVIVPYFF